MSINYLPTIYVIYMTDDDKTTKTTMYTKEKQSRHFRHLTNIPVT